MKSILLCISACIILMRCSPKPPDIFVFEHLGPTISEDAGSGHLVVTPSPTCMKQINEPECGHGIAIVSGGEIFIGEREGHLYHGKPWSRLRIESIYLPAAESYAPLSAYIINSCKRMGCDEEISRFRVRFAGFKTLAE